MKEGIKNIIYWAKTIYKDRQWDFNFILELEEKKIDYMIQWWSNEKNPHIEDSEQVLKELKFYRHLMDLLNDDGHQYLTHTGDVKFKDMDDGTRQLVDVPLVEFKHYVNLRNSRRFVPNIRVSHHKNAEALLKYAVYTEKLWHIFHRYRELKLRNWWD